MRALAGAHIGATNTSITVNGHSVKLHVLCLTANYSQWALAPHSAAQGHRLPRSLPSAEGILSSVSYLLTDWCICLRWTPSACDRSRCHCVPTGRWDEVFGIGQGFITSVFRVKLKNGPAEKSVTDDYRWGLGWANISYIKILCCKNNESLGN